MPKVWVEARRGRIVTLAYLLGMTVVALLAFAVFSLGVPFN